MKNLIITGCLILCSAIGFAQSISVSFVGLNEKDSDAEVVFVINAAALINNMDSRTHQINNQIIQIEKVYDEHSKQIEMASKTGKVIDSAIITYKNNGQTTKVKLEEVLIRNYAWAMVEGEAMVETMELLFKSIH